VKSSTLDRNVTTLMKTKKRQHPLDISAG